MAYVEFLRGRHALIVFTLIVAAVVALALLGYAFSDKHHGVIMNGNGTHSAVPLSILLMIAAYVSAIVASIVGSMLSAEREHRALSLTKPVSRVRFALEYTAVDVATILVAFLVALLLGELFTLRVIGLTTVSLDAKIGPYLLLGLGFAFAFYGIVRALGTAFGRGGMIAGITWPIGFALVALDKLPFPSVLHGLIVGLNFINPIAYLTGFDGTSQQSVLPIDFGARLASEWILAIAAVAVSVGVWNRLED